MAPRFWKLLSKLVVLCDAGACSIKSNSGDIL